MYAKSKSMVLCCTEAMGTACMHWHVHYTNLQKSKLHVPLINLVHQFQAIQPKSYLTLNSRIHQQVKKFLADDAAIPFQFDRLDIDSIIADLDPDAICSITKSVSERRHTSKVSDNTTRAENVKKVRRLYCLCALMFCTEDRCYLPLHNLITDVVDSLGGSTQLVKILNRLGICSSSDTLARCIQHRATERETKGPEQECSRDSITFISADNIDFLHSYAQVFCGNQSSSWHGTTVQAVQPSPSLKLWAQ